VHSHGEDGAVRDSQCGRTVRSAHQPGRCAFDDLLDGDTPQDRLQHLIDAFDTLRPRLADLAATVSPVALGSVRLLPPVPWPGKILITTASYRLIGLALMLQNLLQNVGPRGASRPSLARRGPLLS
jgi:hypothetical protein